MCGILGSVNYSFNQSHLDLLKNRGPDDSGIEEIHVNGNVITFKNNAWEWRLEVNIMGILKEGKFELTEDKSGIIVSFETYYSILGDFLTFLPLVFIVSVLLNDKTGLLFLLGIAFGIIIKKVIVSTKLEDIFEKF